MATARKSATKSKAGKSAAKAGSKKTSAKTKTAKAPAKTKSGKLAAKSPRAVRLTFSYEGDKVKLISQRPVEMNVPPSDPVKGYGNRKGFWADLQNEQDRTLYRHVMHNPTRNDAEVFSDDPEQGISREPAPKRKGVFVVVVPDTDQGHEVRLCRSSGPAPGQASLKGAERNVRSLAAAPAEEIARFKLKKRSSG